MAVPDMLRKRLLRLMKLSRVLAVNLRASSFKYSWCATRTSQYFAEVSLVS
jgi:hypothetical protein